MGIFVLLLVFACGVHGQNISSGLSGTVVDPTDSVIPGVGIQVASLQTGFKRETMTNESGFFAFPDLTPGTYTLFIRQTGFKNYEQKEIALNSGDQRTLGRIKLELGEASQAVSVTADTAQVQLASSEKSSSLTQEDIQNFALRGRDVMDAIALMPGVVDTSEGRESPSQTSTQGLFLAGGRDNSKNVAIDGVTTLDTGSNGSVHSMPSMDSVGEVKVLLSNYAAEYGRNSGGAITIITRGGGKQFHGSAGWYHRHEGYSANNWLNNQRGVQRPPYRYNIGSYTFSGPIYIPGKFNRGRNKLFFFWSQEFQRQLVEYGSRTVTVPTERERMGDFSDSRNTNGALRIVRDPLTERAANGNKVPFAGNVVPISRQDPLGQRILSVFPLPNFVDPIPNRRYQWNHIAIASGSYPRRTEILRLDYQPMQKLQTNIRISNTADRQEVPWGLWVNGGVNFPLTPVIFRQPGRGATLRATWTVSPTTFNEFTAGLSQNRLWYYPRDPEKVDRNKLGINLPQWNPNLNAGNFIPNMNFSQVQNWANPSMADGVPYDNANLILAITDNLSRIWKTHQFKFGFYYERTRKDQSANAATRGTINFNNNQLSEYDTGFTYANAFIGSFNTYTEASARPRGNYFFRNLEFYAQDAWRVKPNLLLDFGVRFYANPPTYDRGLQLHTFSPNAYDPAKAPVLLRPALDENGRTVAVDPVTGRKFGEGFIGTYAPGIGVPAIGMVRAGNGVPKGLYAIPPVMLAPRFGFSWDPFKRGRTAIRGGGGVFYDRIQGNMTYNMLPNPPSIFTPTVYYGTLQTLAQTSGSGVLAPSGTVRAIFGDNPMPTTYNFSLGVQQQLRRGTLLDVSYVGALSRHQLWQRNINAIPLYSTHLEVNPQNRNPARPNNALPGDFLRPIQGYGDILLYEFAATSNYNSLQTRITQRFGRNFNWGASYTFSKALGTSPNDGFTVSPFYSPRSWHYGVLNYDRRHVIAVNYNWVMPWKKNVLARGWQVSGITRGQSGAPFTPGYTLVNGADITGSSSQAARLVVVDGNAPIEQRFRAPMRGELGNLGNNTMRHPGFLNFDISLYRNFKWERWSSQLRLETYNSFNHPQFSSVSTGTRWEGAGSTEQTDPLFGEPISARPPRRIQLALRINW
ncbi:MAG: carboxypeptidase regulatory-like domain-containing protein [Bryobacterales bacterium]|nr:carboxypeptidase regulatory-like domain-containing protein [Bryobacterales bacterium]